MTLPLLIWGYWYQPEETPPVRRPSFDPTGRLMVVRWIAPGLADATSLPPRLASGLVTTADTLSVGHITGLADGEIWSFAVYENEKLAMLFACSALRNEEGLVAGDVTSRRGFPPHVFEARALPLPMPTEAPVMALSRLHVAEELDALVRKGNDDERRVLLYIARRLIGIGRDSYGPLDIRADTRDARVERREEIGDLLVYTALGALKDELAFAVAEAPPQNDDD